jgi:hypothetical protein
VTPLPVPIYRGLRPINLQLTRASKTAIPLRDKAYTAASFPYNHLRTTESLARNYLAVTLSLIRGQLVTVESSLRQSLSIESYNLAYLIDICNNASKGLGFLVCYRPLSLPTSLKTNFRTSLKELFTALPLFKYKYINVLLNSKTLV